jgi:hypothetical protein
MEKSYSGRFESNPLKSINVYSDVVIADISVVTGSVYEGGKI